MVTPQKNTNGRRRTTTAQNRTSVRSLLKNRWWCVSPLERQQVRTSASGVVHPTMVADMQGERSPIRFKSDQPLEFVVNLGSWTPEAVILHWKQEGEAHSEARQVQYAESEFEQRYDEAANDDWDSNQEDRQLI
jgi:hypothetical protein